MKIAVHRQILREAKQQSLLKHRLTLIRNMEGRVVVGLTYSQLEAFQRFQATDPLMQNDFVGGTKH